MEICDEVEEEKEKKCWFLLWVKGSVAVWAVWVDRSGDEFVSIWGEDCVLSACSAVVRRRTTWLQAQGGVCQSEEDHEQEVYESGSKLRRLHHLFVFLPYAVLRPPLFYNTENLVCLLSVTFNYNAKISFIFWLNSFAFFFFLGWV